MYSMNPTYEGGARYDLSRFLRYVRSMYDALDSAWIRELRLLPMAGAMQITTQAYRPDLLGVDIYGDPETWTIPLIYTGIIDVELLHTGTEVRYPALADVESLYFRLIAKARAEGTV